MMLHLETKVLHFQIISGLSSESTQNIELVVLSESNVGEIKVIVVNSCHGIGILDAGCKCWIV